MKCKIIIILLVFTISTSALPPNGLTRPISSMDPILEYKSGPTFGILGLFERITRLNLGLDKYGVCPPVRSTNCPPSVKSLGPSNLCYDDYSCSATQKCCFDSCLKCKVCRIPFRYGR